MPIYRGGAAMPMAAREFGAVLRTVVDSEWPSFGFRLSSALPYYGDVNEREFCIRPSGLGRNALRPFIEGTVREIGPESLVEFRVRPARLVAAFLVACSLAFILGDAGLVVQELGAGRHMSWAMLIPVVVAVFLYVVWIRTVQVAGRNFEALLTEFLKRNQALSRKVD